MDPGQTLSNLTAAVEQVIFGKRAVVQQILVGLLCRGHILIEDVPGVGKTTLVRALARAAGCEFRRIQFTPDLLPSDVTGISVYNTRSGEFEFRPGPVISQIVLADEINRTSPKTQSALLECMEERQATIDGRTYPMPEPFLVLATQNPIEYEGTFPLPESQLDRFLMRIQVGYPSFDTERHILEQADDGPAVAELQPVADPESIAALQAAAAAVHTDRSLYDYIVSITQATRNHPEVHLGCSPRGSLALLRASHAWALLQGRDYVQPDDIKFMAAPCLAHRLILRPEVGLQGRTASAIVADVLRQVAVPTG